MSLDHAGIGSVQFGIGLCDCVHRQVDVFLRYTRVLWVTNERDQTRSFQAEVIQIVHESWLPIQLVDFSLFYAGVLLFWNLTAHSKGVESLCVFTYPCSGQQNGSQELKPYARLLGPQPLIPL